MKRALALAVLLLVASGTPGARADDPADSEPALAYERGQSAFEQKDYAGAARYFARADELAPSNAALESGLKAALLADHPAFGMELAERADARKVPASITVLVDRARKTFGTRAGKLTVRCPPPATRCSVAMDGQSIPAATPVWAPVGERAILVVSDGARREERIEVRAGTTVELVPAAAAAPAPSAGAPSASGEPGEISAAPFASSASDDAASRGISPVYFIVTAAATAVLAGVTIWSGVDTLGIHDDFQAGDVAARDAGQSAQLRTNVLIGVAAGGGAATIVLGFVTDFGGAQPVSTKKTSRSTLLEPPSF